jgi:hypothetical protein
MLRVLSLGAGVQSTTLALMAAHGEIAPMLDCAIFADTQSEPEGVYRHLDWLETRLPFPVHRVTAGSLRQQILDGARGIGKVNGRPPLHVRNPDGTKGFTNRQCTQDFKILPIQRKLRELIGLLPRQRSPKEIRVEQWIGISTDEASRMKPSQLSFVRHCWPLIDARMSRQDCLRWLERHGYPRPGKSACTFCPFHNDAMWREMRDSDPASWADAIMVDDALREHPGKLMLRGTPYLHASLTPLGRVDLSTAEDRGQLNLFGNECEGMCGV